MSGAQPPGSFTATTYESVQEAKEGNWPKTQLNSRDDDKGIKIYSLHDKIEDSAGRGGPVFCPGRDEPPNKQDLGVTGTSYEQRRVVTFRVTRPASRICSLVSLR